ncbi:AMP-binding protein [Novosphingobium ginsenosidimutans]|uniref:AMP-binding protein n=1 Tax=Novosphingobium ginsenosidimutans TaxID=1176536 RepID=A0A5B8S7M7_9SPHN|nr:AMP-binding protein [Novosphingobium ginsenosidimutans]QEA17002.1 AMP-binding protein [Novosphingobium ginsenosidimutans]
MKDQQFAAADWLDDNGLPRPGAPMGMLLSAHAALRPDAPAFTFDGETLSFRQCDSRANVLARALALRGVASGDRVVVSMPNRPDHALAINAIWKLGATPCSVSHRLTPSEFREVLELAEPRLVIGTSQTPASASSLFDIDAPLSGELDDRPLPPALSTPGKILASGGSTGRPKLIVDPRNSGWGPDKVNLYRPPLSTVLCAGPLYHAAPFAFVIVGLAEGSHVICMERFEPVEWLRLAERYQATVATMVPTMMSRIARLDPAITIAADLSSFRFIMHSSAPCPEDVKRWWLSKVAPETLWEVYGSTERLGSTLINGTEWLEHPGSVGRANAGDTIIIAGPDGTPLPPGEIGEIFFRRAAGVGTSYRYIGAESRIRGDLDGLGDMGWLDADGYLFIADRRTDMILVGGVNVWPAEVEAALEQVPGVLCAAVIGLPDPDLGNRVHAIIELAQHVEVPKADAALAFLAAGLERLASFKRPRSAEFTYERVRDDAGKVRRAALRAERIGVH